MTHDGQTLGDAVNETKIEHLEDVYAQRFGDDEAAAKNTIWEVIGSYLQRFVPNEGVVLDLACDRGDFIRNIDARERWASDVRDVSHHLSSSIRFVQANGLSIDRSVPEEYFDLVFMSNYLEHLPSGDHVVEQLRVIARVLKPHGRVMILQPNIRLTGVAYWDFIDHKVALTEKSLVEACELAGFRLEHMVRRFLPYTTKSRLPTSPRLVRLYLALPFAWRILGQQTLYVGRRD